jgi:hypothetical protein
MIKEQLQSMLNEGYNLNQIAAIHMISKIELEKLLVDEAVEATSTGTKGKSKSPANYGIQDTPLFQDEPGL